MTENIKSSILGNLVATTIFTFTLGMLTMPTSYFIAKGHLAMSLCSGSAMIGSLLIILGQVAAIEKSLNAAVANKDAG